MTRPPTSAARSCWRCLGWRESRPPTSRCHRTSRPEPTWKPDWTRRNPEVECCFRGRQPLRPSSTFSRPRCLARPPAGVPCSSGCRCSWPSGSAGAGSWIASSWTWGRPRGSRWPRRCCCCCPRCRSFEKSRISIKGNGRCRKPRTGFRMSWFGRRCWNKKVESVFFFLFSKL